MSTPAWRYIDLDRRFLDFEDLDNLEEAAYKSYLSGLPLSNRGLSWNELLQSPYVVVLGEPGTGKTVELRERAQILERDGKYAFFVRLDRLVGGSLDSALDPPDELQFQQWTRNQGTAIFFLDSVDEAKILKLEAFSDALSNIARSLGHHGLRRARLVISCRVSEWRGRADRHTLQRAFSIADENPPENENASERIPPVLRIVSLVQLDAERIGKYAAHLGASPPEAFLQAIEARHAWDLAGRPADVESLVKYRLKHRCLGTWKKLCENDVSEKLTESEQRQPKDPLTPERARQGAEHLAAAVIFTRSFNVLLPDTSHEPAVASCAISPQRALPDNWKPVEIRALLARGIFDGAAYRRIRFHHRILTEYLAAEWLARRVREGCPYPVLEQLLFPEIHGMTVVPPSRAPLAAWLALGEELWNQRIRERLVRDHPEVLLAHGDPESLPVEARRTLLRTLVARYKGRNRAFLPHDSASLNRIAHADLADDITSIIRDRRISEEVRRLCLGICRHGQLPQCLDAAIEIIASPEESDHLKSYAAAAIRDAGTIGQKGRLKKFAMRLEGTSINSFTWVAKR